MGVGFGGRAVDAQRMDNAALRVFELPRVARGAGQSQLSRRDRTVDDEADRQPFRVCRRDVVGEIAVAQQFIAGEWLVDVGALERLEPGIGHQARTLARCVEGFAICGRPALRGVGECADRASLLRLSLDGPQSQSQSERQNRAPHNAFSAHVSSLFVGGYRRCAEKCLSWSRNGPSVWRRRGKPIVTPVYPNVNRRRRNETVASSLWPIQRASS